MIELTMLPNGDRVNREQIASKLATYVLNDNHDEGQHKSRLFKSILGISLENQSLLEDALIQAAQQREIVYSATTQYGEKFVLDFSMATEIGIASVRSVWIIRNEENHPRLITAYPLT